MTDQIRFRDKKGNIKYIADSKGKVAEVGRDGKLHQIDMKESGKIEEVTITPEDMKE